MSNKKRNGDLVFTVSSLLFTHILRSRPALWRISNDGGLWRASAGAGANGLAIETLRQVFTLLR